MPEELSIPISRASTTHQLVETLLEVSFAVDGSVSELRNDAVFGTVNGTVFKETDRIEVLVGSGEMDAFLTRVEKTALMTIHRKLMGRGRERI